MAAGIITELVTTRTGATVPLQFFVDDTVSPTKYWHVQTVVDQAGAEIFGEVTASPASNTIGDRLKTLNSSLTGGTAKTQIVDSTLANVTFEPSVASGSADSGNPIKIGGKAKAGLSGVTLFSADNRGNAHMALDGAFYTHPHCGLEDIVSGVAAITDGSSTSVIASSGAGVKTYITTAIIANTSATAVTVDLRDGAAGTVKATLPVPANTSGVVCNLPMPLPGSAATAWCADPSAAASTITVTLIGFKSKI